MKWFLISAIVALGLALVLVVLVFLYIQNLSKAAENEVKNSSFYNTPTEEATFKSIK